MSFERWNIGDFASLDHTITTEDIQKFVDITGDDNRLHVDRDYAQKTTFKGIVAHGMLGASFISTIIGKHIPGDGALWMSQNLNFLLPVRVGDQITISAEIIKIHPKRRLLTLKTEIKNQYHQIVTSGEAQVKHLQEVQIQEKRVLKKEKVALVTGASKGIGAATAVKLAQDGFKVIVNYHSDQQGAEDILKQIQDSGGDALIYKADVRKQEEVLNMVEAGVRKFGTITALVKNATSKIIPRKLEETDWGNIQADLDVQVKGAFHCIQAVLSEFLKNGNGSIVNLGSIYTDNVPPPQLLGYTMAKHALNSMTRSIAVEFGPKHIRCNSVSPGMTDTALISEVPEKTRLLT